MSIGNASQISLLAGVGNFAGKVCSRRLVSNYRLKPCRSSTLWMLNFTRFCGSGAWQFSAAALQVFGRVHGSMMIGKARPPPEWLY